MCRLSQALLVALLAGRVTGVALRLLLRQKLGFLGLLGGKFARGSFCSFPCRLRDRFGFGGLAGGLLGVANALGIGALIGDAHPLRLTRETLGIVRVRLRLYPFKQGLLG